MTVRTRVAPSPTGDPHVGTAYVALFNLAFARRHAGAFVLRIEDTDRARSTPESEAAIVDALRWAGLEWDEGPDKGGAYGPYRQSERVALYREHADRLVAEGNAFPCFCSPERLEDRRRERRARGENPGYDGHCLTLDAADARRRIDAGEPYVIRMRVPVEGTCRVVDRLRGVVEIPWAQVDMQVLLKSDGFPTYHLAVVVDDHLMAITHVLRGEEWIGSMPKHQLLYRYLGWEMPEHTHLPLLRNPDRSKLSKRRNPTSLNYFRDVGYLPEALCNYLGLMGWSMPDEREIFSFEEMVEAFDVDRVATSGPVFDFEKLNWLNGQYLRSLSADAFADRVADWALGRENLRRLVPLVQPRTERFIDLAPQVDYLIGERAPLTAEAFAHKTLSDADCRRILHHVLRALDEMPRLTGDALLARCKGLATAMDLKIRDFLFPLFVAVSGRAVALPLFDSVAFLGRDLTRARIRSALTALGGLSKKEAKRLDKAFEAMPGRVAPEFPGELTVSGDRT